MTRVNTLMFRSIVTRLAILVFVILGSRDVCAVDDAATVKEHVPADVRMVDPPKRVEFHLQDGVKITGTLSSWDDDGIDGSFGRRAWWELNAEDVWVLHVYLMDRNSTAQWVNLGRVMLLTPKGAERAETAFKHAQNLDANSADAIVAARAWAAEEIRKREEAIQQTEAAKLRTVSPEAGPWTNAPWPELTAEDRFAASFEVKRDAEAMLEKAGLEITPVETEWFVLYSDAPRPDAAKWVIRLERAYRRLARQFEIHSSQNIFYGKAVIFVFTDHDRYRLVEAEAFNQLVPHGAVGLCQYDGPKVFMCFHRDDDEDRLLWQMFVELTHAFVHRIDSAMRLPAWANEGLADTIAAQEMHGTLIEQDRHEQALSFIRNQGNVLELLDRTYDDFDWTERWERLTQVSGLIVELMLRDRPAPFLQWVHAVKRGKDWREALKENFGVEPMAIIETAVQHFMVND